MNFRSGKYVLFGYIMSEIDEDVEVISVTDFKEDQ